MQTVMGTFVLAKFVHIGNISAVTDPILTKLSDQFFGGLNFWDQNFWNFDFFSTHKYRFSNYVILF